MTYIKAQAVKAICEAAGLTALKMHDKDSNGEIYHYVELPCPLAWEVADWQRQTADAVMPVTESLAA